MHPAILLALLVAVLLLISWYKHATPTQQRKIRNKSLLIAGIGLVLVLLLTGRLHPLFAAAAALIPIAQRLFGLLQVANTVKGFRDSMRSGGSPSQGQSSKVETRYVRMTLEHDTGEMGGVVLEGPLRGRQLSELSLEQLLELLAQARADDAQSAAVLEAYLDRVHGDAWRDQAGGAGTRGADAASAEMSPAEAREILGVGPEAGRDEIIAAHRRLMQKLHPDRGGSTYLAAKINQAKEMLLEG